MIQEVNAISFKGYDNVTAGRTDENGVKCYVLSAKLNNEGVNDFDRFSKLLSKANDDILTIHFEEFGPNINPLAPEGASFINVNNFPLLIDKKEMKAVPEEQFKYVENITLSLTTKLADLLKRIVKEPKIQLIDPADKSFVKTINSMCGLFAGNPEVVKEVRRHVFADYAVNKIDVTTNTAKNILDAINTKMIKYFL